MARKKKKKLEEQESAGGFVPASLETAHAHSNSFSFGGSPDSGAPAAEPGSFEQYSRNVADYSNRKKKGMRTGAKVAIAVLIVALVAGVSALGLYIYKETQKQAINADLHKMSQDVMEAIDNELTGMTTFEEPFTVLLLGSDERSDPDEDIGARTDTIVLVRIDPVHNAISMVSIPRDTKVEVEGGGTMKINATYAYGGPSGTIAAVKELCGVEIDHYAEINFEGLVGLVDAIGGIDLHVDEEIVDTDAGDYAVPAGDLHLDGTGALIVARSRAYADGDFTRVKNQRKVIEAILRRGLETPSTELYGLIKVSTEFLTTDSAMDVDFIFSLAEQIRHNDYPVQLSSATIPATTQTIDGASYVIADQAGVDEMMEVLMAGGDVAALDSSAEVDADAAASELSEVGVESTGAAGAAGAGTSAYGGAGAEGGGYGYGSSASSYGSDGY